MTSSLDEMHYMEAYGLLHQLKLMGDVNIPFPTIKSSWATTLSSCLVIFNEKTSLKDKRNNSLAEVCLHIETCLQNNHDIKDQEPNDNDNDNDNDLVCLDKGRLQVTMLFIHAQLRQTIHFLLETIQAIPEWIEFWTGQNKRYYIFYKIEQGPFEWCLPRRKRIHIKERIRALHHLFELYLKKIGNLKTLELKLLSLHHLNSNDIVSNDRMVLQSIVNEILVAIHTTLEIPKPSDVQARTGWNLHHKQENKENETIKGSLIQELVLGETDSISTTMASIVHHIKSIATSQDGYASSFTVTVKGCEQPTRLQRKYVISKFEYIY